MNGAQALIRTLVDYGVDVCFTNPGTSEMHFVAALDDVPEMRGVLGLFEGVVTGAADGYAPHGRPARGHAAAPRSRPRQRARQPAQRPPGAHADRQHRRRPRHVPQAVRRAARVRHRRRSPRNVSGWIRTLDATPRTSAATPPTRSPRPCGPPGQVATLILPADVVVARRRRARPRPRRRAGRAAVPDERDRRSSPRRSRSGEPAALLLGGARRARAPACAPRAGSPPRPAPSSSARRSRPGSSAARALPAVERLGYLAEFADDAARRAAPPRARRRQGAGVVLRLPRQGRATSCPTAARCTSLADGRRRRRRPRSSALADARRRRDADRRPPGRASRPERPTGALTARDRSPSAVGALAARGRDRRRRGADRRALSSPARPPARPPPRLAHPHRRRDRPRACRSRPAPPSRAPTAPVHQPRGRRQRDVHAAVAVDPGPRGPRRHHGHLQQPVATPSSTSSSAGSASSAPGPKALSMLDLTGPDLDFVALARAWACRRPAPKTAKQLTTALERALAEPGPHLIEAVFPSGF